MSTAYADPNSDVAYTWADNAATDYTRVDDGVRDPTDASTSGDGQQCVAGDADDSEIATFGCTEPSISGTVTQVKVKVFMTTGGPSISVDVGAYFGGSNRTASSHTPTSATWYTTTYSSLSIAAGSFYPCKINITPGAIGKGDQLTVYAAYLEITYTPAGGGSTHSRTLTNNLGSADSQGGAGVGQTILLAILFRRALSHTFGFSDLVTPAVQQVRMRLVADLLVTTETLRRATETRRDVHELLKLDERQLVLTEAYRAIGEQLSFAEKSFLQALIARIVIDLAVAGDTFAISVLRHLMVNDSLNLADLHQHAGNLLRELADSFGSTDSVFRKSDVRRMLLELADIFDDVLRRRILGNVLPGDADFVSLGPSDAAFASAGPGSAAKESLGPGNVSVTPKGSND